MNNNLIVIAGPTGIGKTSLGITLAEHFNAEIADRITTGMHDFYKIGLLRGYFIEHTESDIYNCIMQQCVALAKSFIIATLSSLWLPSLVVRVLIKHLKNSSQKANLLLSAKYPNLAGLYLKEGTKDFSVELEPEKIFLVSLLFECNELSIKDFPDIFGPI